MIDEAAIHRWQAEQSVRREALKARLWEIDEEMDRLQDERRRVLDNLEACRGASNLLSTQLSAVMHGKNRN